MGALISTIGTRYLIGHLNRAFSAPRIGHLRKDPPGSALPAGTTVPAGSVIMDYFNDPSPTVDLLWLSQNITHKGITSRPDSKCFLPEDINRSKNTELRWLYYLTIGNPGNVLTAANHAAIKSAIYTGLSSLRAGVFTYERIEFDCVDGGGTQAVFAADEKDDHGRVYFKVVLVTPPIPANTSGVIIAGLPPRDPQPGP